MNGRWRGGCSINLFGMCLIRIVFGNDETRRVVVRSNVLMLCTHVSVTTFAELESPKIMLLADGGLAAPA